MRLKSFALNFYITQNYTRNCGTCRILRPDFARPCHKSLLPKLTGIGGRAFLHLLIIYASNENTHLMFGHYFIQFYSVYSVDAFKMQVKE